MISEHFKEHAIMGVGLFPGFGTSHSTAAYGDHVHAGMPSTLLASGCIWVGNNLGGAMPVTLSGDAALSNTGVLGVNKTRLNVRNEGSLIPSTRAVYVSGFDNYPLISLANNGTEVAHNVVGVTIAPIGANANGFIATTGQFDAQTKAWPVGTELYLGAAGVLTSTPPTSGSVRHVAIVMVSEDYPVGKLLIYNFPEENYFAGGAGTDNIIRIGDSLGANKVSFRNYANVEVASIDSLGNAFFPKISSSSIRHVFWPSGGMIPRPVNGAYAAILESSINHVMLDVYDFDPVTAEFGCFTGNLERWNGGTIKCRPSWTAGSGSGGVVWGFQARAYADTDALDQAWGSIQTSTDTLNSVLTENVGPATAAISVEVTPASGTRLSLQVSRVPSDGSDTLAVDARLLGVWIEYTEKSTPETAW